MPKITSKRVPLPGSVAKLGRHANKTGKAPRASRQSPDGVADPVERSIQELVRLTQDLKQQLALP